MKVLVHYNAAGTEAFGLWWVDEVEKSPQALYFDPNGPMATRGRVIVYGKTNPRVSWSTWFDMLTARAPYTEDWVVYDSMGMTPEQMLSSLKPSEPVAS